MSVAPRLDTHDDPLSTARQASEAEVPVGDGALRVFEGRASSRPLDRCVLKSLSRPQPGRLTCPLHLPLNRETRRLSIYHFARLHPILSCYSPSAVAYGTAHGLGHSFRSDGLCRVRQDGGKPQALGSRDRRKSPPRPYPKIRPLTKTPRIHLEAVRSALDPDAQESDAERRRPAGLHPQLDILLGRTRTAFGPERTLRGWRRRRRSVAVVAGVRGR